MIGTVNLKAAHQGNKYDIMEIKDYARSLGFFDVPGFKSKLESLSSKLIKTTKADFLSLNFATVHVAEYTVSMPGCHGKINSHLVFQRKIQ